MASPGVGLFACRSGVVSVIVGALGFSTYFWPYIHSCQSFWAWANRGSVWVMGPSPNFPAGLLASRSFAFSASWFSGVHFGVCASSATVDGGVWQLAVGLWGFGCLPGRGLELQLSGPALVWWLFFWPSPFPGLPFPLGCLGGSSGCVFGGPHSPFPVGLELGRGWGRQWPPAPHGWCQSVD